MENRSLSNNQIFCGRMKDGITVTKVTERDIEIEIVDIDGKELERINESFLDLMTEIFLEWHESEVSND
ncbi:hypothetical protein [Gudongella oleilytica]|uniref:hypothetical protein n=1 Tax=Gudongella oleilytica TaxID=1582259 RepID=UPI002A361E69|nr:hypothetical protein [Gudongella oleilytica]MDY0257295.1 hypothetical protein [Gudongella oleilytica]